MKIKKGMAFQKLAEKLERPGYFIKVWLILGVALNLLVELLSRKSIISLGKYIFLSPFTFLYNTTIILATLSIALIFRKRLFGLILMSILWIAIGVTDSILLVFRTTPFTAQDLRLIQYALRISQKYLGLAGVILIVAGVVIVLAALVLLYIIIAPGPTKGHRFKHITITMSCFFVVFSLTWLGNTIGMLSLHFSNIHDAYETYGVPYCFSGTLLNTGISKPSDYGKETVDNILSGIDEHEGRDRTSEDPEVTEVAGLASDPGTQVGTDNSKVAAVNTLAAESAEDNGAHETEAPSKEAYSTQPGETVEEPWYVKAAQKIAKPREDGKVNLIAVQLESLFDLQKYTAVQYDKDPTPFLHAMMRQCTSGYVSVPSIGAGTANTEFEMLTSMNMYSFGPGEYPYKTILNKKTCESAPYVLKNLGYRAHAIHNNDATFYERHHVFSNLGFDTFTSMEYMYDLSYTENGWPEDMCLIPYIMDTLRSDEEADFIYTISVQGHGPYPDGSIIEDPAIHVVWTDSEREDQKYAFEYYANQAYEMDCMMAELVDQLRGFDEPVMLLMFGDHLPGLSIDEEQLNGYGLYETPFAIWTNYEMPREVVNLEAFQVIPYMMSRLDIHEGFIYRLHEKYLDDRKNAGDGWTEEDEEQYLKELEVIEYDILYGDQIAYNGQLPFEPTDLQMGIRPIEITDVYSKENVLIVSGSGFNDYSVIYVDGKELDTICVSSKSLLAVDYEPDPDEEQIIRVGQVGVDSVVLGYTDEYVYDYDVNDQVEIIHQNLNPE
ncbi:MAG: sulfatase-like hydrolase/transferase [Lachnospiraceae bacterium]|nr:sulfatase-like hydrolase/transferase [Lachnospiraceae bacterium]